jgi:hypothetical protein
MDPSELYNLRHSVLVEATQMLMARWDVAMDIERAQADQDGRPPKVLPPPTMNEICAVAKVMWGFVIDPG